MAKLPDRRRYPVYAENPIQRAADFDEARRALRGEVSAAVRQADDGLLVIGVAVPVQRFVQGRYPLADAEQALAHAARRGALKVLVAPGEL